MHVGFRRCTSKVTQFLWLMVKERDGTQLMTLAVVAETKEDNVSFVTSLLQGRLIFRWHGCWRKLISSAGCPRSSNETLLRCVIFHSPMMVLPLLFFVYLCFSMKLFLSTSRVFWQVAPCDEDINMKLCLQTDPDHCVTFAGRHNVEAFEIPPPKRSELYLLIVTSW